MSRSYRHNFVFASEGDKHEKKRFNRKLRRTHTDVASNSHYRKANCSWLIKCFKFRYDNEDHFVRNNLGYGKTEKELRKIWRKTYLSK